MRRLLLIILLIFSFVLSLNSGVTHAQTQTWIYTDGSGDVRFADDYKQIPPQYRQNASPGSLRAKEQESKQGEADHRSMQQKMYLPKEPPPRQESERFIYTKPGYIGCATEFWLDRITSMIGQNDMEAANKMIAEGKCVRMQGDIQVFVEEAKGNPIDKIKVRPKGYTEGFWTYMKSLSLSKTYKEDQP